MSADTDKLSAMILLAISEVHSGNGAEGQRIADAAILALREWLEAEAAEARKTREEVKAEPSASDYRKGYFAGAEFAIDCLVGKIAAAPDALDTKGDG
jgi:transposase